MRRHIIRQGYRSGIRCILVIRTFSAHVPTPTQYLGAGSESTRLAFCLSLWAERILVIACIYMFLLFYRVCV